MLDLLLGLLFLSILIMSFFRNKARKVENKVKEQKIRKAMVVTLILAGIVFAVKMIGRS